MIFETGIRVTQRAETPKSNRRIDAWGKPLNLPASERTYEQKRFETYGNLGGMHGGVVGIDPQIAAHLSKSRQPSSTFGSGRGSRSNGGGRDSFGQIKSPSKVVRLRMGSPTRVSRRAITEQSNAHDLQIAFDRNTWRL